MIFVGRERELEVLEKNVKRLDEGKSSVVFIDAEPGAGKTALVQTFLKGLPENKFTIAFVNCDDKDGIIPYGAINRLYLQLQLAGIFSTKFDWKDSFKKLSSGIGKDIIESLPGGNTISSIIDVASAFKRKNNQSNSKTIDEKQQLIDDILKASRKKPLILFWDDLQWIDGISAAFIFTFCKALRENKYAVFVIGTYRTHEVNKGTNNNGRHPMADKINELRGYSRKEAHVGDNNSFEELHLSVLKQDEIKQLVDRKFPKNAFPEDFVAENLYKNTKGNALFANSILDLLVERGGIINNGGIFELRQESIGEIPRDVQGVIKERYESLSKELQKTLDVASVNGYDFTIQIIERILKLDKSDLLDQLEELEKQHNLFIPASRKNIQEKLNNTYSFTHALIHKYVYDNITDERRRFLHAKVADLLLELYGTKENMPNNIREQYSNHLRIGQGLEYSSVLQLTQKRSNDQEISRYLEVLTDNHINYWTFFVENGQADKCLIQRHHGLELDSGLTREIEALEFFTNIFELGQFDPLLVKQYANTRVFQLSILRIAQLFQKQYKYEQAIILWKESLNVYLKLNDSKILVHIFKNIANCYLWVFDYNNAIRFYDQATDVLRATEGDKYVLADILYNTGICYENTYDYNKALSCYDKAMDLLGHTDEENTILGLNLKYHHDPLEYITFLGTLREVENKEILAYTLMRMGECHIKTGNYRDALNPLDLSITLFQIIGERESEGLTLFSIGDCYKQIKNYQLAIQKYSSSVEILREIDHWELFVAITLCKIAACYFEEGDYENAINFYKSSIDIFERWDSELQLASVLHKIGRSYEHLKHYQEAIHFYTLSTYLDRKLDFKKNLAINLDSIGNCCVNMKDYEKGIKYYNDAVDLIRELDDIKTLSYVLFKIAGCCLRKNDHRSAIHFYTESADLCRKLGDRQSYEEVMERLEELMKKLS